MNPEEQIAKPEIELEELDLDSAESVDDFIKELEAKERDLHITADLSIEIEESDFDSDQVPAFVAEEIKQPAANSEPALTGQSKATQTVSKTRIYELEQEVKKLRTRINELRSERDDIQESSDRRLKDFQNFKYRVDRERRGSFIDQLANLATRMLPVLDNLDRALAAAENASPTRSPEFQQFYEGIILVNQQVNEVLGEMGVSTISSVGEMFDPALHEAVAVEENDGMPRNTISGEMLRGFRIGNRVIRHSMVKVTTPSQTASKTDPVEEPAADENVVGEGQLADPLKDFEFSDDAPAAPDASTPEA